MPIPITCPSCGMTLTADEAFLNKRVRCRHCQDVFVATAPADAGEDDYVPILEAEAGQHSGKAIGSLVLGIIGLVAWCLPIAGLPLTVGGLVLGIMGLRSANRGLAVAGVVLNILGLLLSVINAAIGAYLGATGQHPLLR